MCKLKMGCFLRWDKSVLITTNTLPCSPRTSASASASSAASCTWSSAASASRVLPGFQPDSKIRMLQQLRDDAEIVIAVNANDIEKNKVRGDLGIGIHAPYDTGRSGYYNMESFGKSLAFHLAIGYPF